MFASDPLSNILLAPSLKYLKLVSDHSPAGRVNVMLEFSYELCSDTGAFLPLEALQLNCECCSCVIRRQRETVVVCTETLLHPEDLE